MNNFLRKLYLALSQFFDGLQSFYFFSGEKNNALDKWNPYHLSLFN